MQTKAAKDNLKSWMKLTRKSVGKLRKEQAAVDQLRSQILLALKAKLLVQLEDKRRPQHNPTSNYLGLDDESSTLSRNGGQDNSFFEVKLEGNTSYRTS